MDSVSKPNDNLEVKSSCRHSGHILSRILGRFRSTEHTVSGEKNTEKICVNSSSVGLEQTTEMPEPMNNSPTTPTVEDKRYGGQFLTPEQLPSFCDQLRHLIAVVTNIQEYAEVTGEYPRRLQCRLAAEARALAALAAEARGARDAAERARAQRFAVRAVRRELACELRRLREDENRELERAVRLSDRVLFKTWETIRDKADVEALNNFMDEIQSKQNALRSLQRLIEHRLAVLTIPRRHVEKKRKRSELAPPTLVSRIDEADLC